MRTKVAAVLMLLSLVHPPNAFPAAPANDLLVIGKPIGPLKPDTGIESALKQISEASIRQTIEKLVTFNNRNTLSSMTTDLKGGTGVLAAADWIESQFKLYSTACGGCLDVKRGTFTAPVQTRVPQPTTLVNIYAVLHGSDPSQAARQYLVTGHYDSRNTDVLDTHGAAPGANDDASGVAVSLECARVLSKLKLPATVVFAAVAGEEQGLIGSAHLAKLARDEGWQLEAVLNNDIVGGNTTPGDTLQDKSALRVFSEGIPATASPEQMRQIEALGSVSDSASRQLARAIAEIGETYTAPAFHARMELRHDRFLRGGDHSSFNKEGFAAVRFTEWREDFNHQHQDLRTEKGIEYGDLLKFVDYAYVTNVAKLNATTLATLAMAPPQPRDVKIVTKNLDNNTTLEWKGPENTAEGTSYEIVWRATTASDWQRFAPSSAFGDTGSGGNHSATLPISKDNVFFGVRSVNAAGQPSPAVPPTPAR